MPNDNLSRHPKPPNGKGLGPLGKAITWTCMTALFGLLQVWLILATSFVLVGESLSTNFDKLFLDGALLFFSIAIVSSLTIDHHLSQRTFQSDLFDKFMFTFFPVMILIVCVWLFTTCFGKQENELNFVFVQILECFIFFMALIYGFIVKISAFNQEACQ